MRSLRVIVGTKGSQEPAVLHAVETVRHRGHVVEVQVTEEVGEGEHFAREAAEAGYDVVVAGGGDGTISDVARGLLAARKSARTALALLPLGTGNDLARSLGIPLDDPTAALIAAAEGTVGALDVGLINDQAFVNVASGGFGAEVTAKTPSEWKNALGSAAYSLTGLLSAATLRPYACRLVAEGQSLELSSALLAIGNGRFAGGGYAVAPQARLDDGLLDLAIIPAVPLADLPTLVGELFQVADEGNEHILYWQLAEFELHFADEFPMNLDGEPLAGHNFRVRVMPARLAIVSPAGMSGVGPAR